MTELKELNPKDHGDLKVALDSAINIAKQQHLINLKVSEVGQAMTNFPIFATKVTDTNEWSISAITSFDINANLFVKDDTWEGSYQPTSMQTYPFFLMNSPKGEGQFTMGIDESNDAFSKDKGEALFEENGKASIYLSRVTAQLESDIANEIHTYKFTQRLAELDLFKAMDLQVYYKEGRVNTLKGLNTIDEEKLQNLDSEAFEDLRKTGYLMPAHALLMSIFQLNAMIKRHNEYGGLNTIDHVKLEAPKDNNDAA